MQQRNAPAGLDESRAHFFRQVIVRVVILGAIHQELVIGLHKLVPELRADRIQVANEPAGQFKIPVVRQPDEAVVRGDVGEEGELPAGDAAVLALAGLRTQAGQQTHMRGGVRFQAAGVLGLGCAFVPAPGVPELGARAQVLPFFGVGNRDSAADIAAKRDAARVVGGAAQAAIEVGGRRIEACVDFRDVEGRTGHRIILSKGTAGS
jgi:hypothetical protein